MLSEDELLMLPVSWKPSDRHQRVRLGDQNDGGYVVGKSFLEGDPVLISMGLNDDWSFERDFLAQGGERVICFDHSVTPGFWLEYIGKRLVKRQFRRLRKPLDYRKFFSSPRAEHRREKVGHASAGEVTLTGIVRELPADCTLALKVDIEGSEYRILDEITLVESRLTGLAIEFHDVDLHRQRISAFIQRLEHLEPVWVHGNNWGGTDPCGDPRVIEMSFARAAARGERSDATELTTPNDPGKPELSLVYAEEP